jgi:hypothetical protein
MARTRKSNVDNISGRSTMPASEWELPVDTLDPANAPVPDKRRATLGIAQISVVPSSIPGYHVIYAVATDGTLWTRRPPLFTWEKAEALPQPAGDG